MRRFYCKVRELFPVFSIVTFIITMISFIFHISFINSERFANYFNYSISAPFRCLMAKLFVIFPFSIAELLIILSPIILVTLIFLSVKYGKKSFKASIRFFSVILSVLCIVYITFVFTYSSGYYTSELEIKMDLNTSDVDVETLKDSAEILVRELNSLVNEIQYNEEKASVMPYSYDEMSKRICNAYDNFCNDYGLIKTFDSRIKPIALSEPMTYTHISGIYSFMTGEANVNVNYPDFVIASSSAHELAHQRGIARENEANFISFLVLSQSDDVFLRYSAYLDVYGYVMSSLYRENAEQYKEIYSKLDSRVKNDRISYSSFFEKYSDSKASEVADKVNNSYLQANGQHDGTKSYGKVTLLACAYLTKAYK